MGPLVIIGIAFAGEAILMGGGIFAINKVLTQQRSTALKEAKKLFRTEVSRVENQVKTFTEGLADLADRSFR